MCVWSRRNCELGATLAQMYHKQYLTKRVNVHTHEFYLNRQSKYVTSPHTVISHQQGPRFSAALAPRHGILRAHRGKPYISRNAAEFNAQ